MFLQCPGNVARLAQVVGRDQPGRLTPPYRPGLDRHAEPLRRGVGQDGALPVGQGEDARRPPAPGVQHGRKPLPIARSPPVARQFLMTILCHLAVTAIGQATYLPLEELAAAREVAAGLDLDELVSKMLGELVR